MARWLVASLGLLLVLADARSQPAPKARKYAVLVGVNQYGHAKLTELRYAENDVTELAKLLQPAGYEVTLLTSATKLPPTRANVEAELKRVLSAFRKGDTVLIALAGHGLQFDKDKDAYFCPSDAKPFADATDTLVSVGGIYRALERSHDGMKVLLVDACRNDPDPNRGARGGIDADNAPKPPSGVAALFSCKAGEVAFEHESLKHGVFFHQVLQGLRGEAADKRGRVTFAGLASHVSTSVAEAVPKLFEGKRQSPNLKADYSVEPVLIVAAAKTGDGSGVKPPDAPRVEPGVTAPFTLDFRKLDANLHPAGWTGATQIVKGRGNWLEVSEDGTFALRSPELTMGGDFLLTLAFSIPSGKAIEIVLVGRGGKDLTIGGEAYGGHAGLGAHLNKLTLAGGPAAHQAKAIASPIHRLVLERKGPIFVLSRDGEEVHRKNLGEFKDFEAIELRLPGGKQPPTQFHALTLKPLTAAAPVDNPTPPSGAVVPGGGDTRGYEFKPSATNKAMPKEWRTSEQVDVLSDAKEGTRLEGRKGKHFVEVPGLSVRGDFVFEMRFQLSGNTSLKATFAGPGGQAVALKPYWGNGSNLTGIELIDTQSRASVKLNRGINHVVLTRKDGRYTVAVNGEQPFPSRRVEAEPNFDTLRFDLELSNLSPFVRIYEFKIAPLDAK